MLWQQMSTKVKKTTTKGNISFILKLKCGIINKKKRLKMLESFVFQPSFRRVSGKIQSPSLQLLKEELHYETPYGKQNSNYNLSLNFKFL